MSCRLVFRWLIAIVALVHKAPGLAAELPAYRWATGMGGEEDDATLGVVADPSGVSFITGYCAGLADFPGTSGLISRGGYDAFVARIDLTGRAVWAIRFGGTNSDYGQAITLDGSSNVLVTGYFVGSADFGPTSLAGFGRDDCFVAKVSPGGQVLWARQAGGTNLDQGAGIASGLAGECLVTGYFRNSASFNGTNLTSRGQSDIFISKYDSSGALLWVQQAGGAGVDEGKAVAVGKNGDIWVTGLFGGVGTFGNTEASALGLGDFFVSRYSPDGSLAWVRTGGGTNTIIADVGAGIVVDGNENCYVCGAFHNNGRFGSVEVMAGSATALFLAKYSHSGELLWVRPAITSSGGIGWDLAIDRRGTILMAGSFVGSAELGGAVRTSRTGQAESFLAAYSPDGQFLWFSQSGGTAYNSAIGLAVDDQNRAYTGGWYRFGNSFGGIQLSNRPTGRNAYIARIDGLPELHAVSDQANIVLSWTVYATNFQLQSSADLTAVNWTTVTNFPSVHGERRTVTRPAMDTRYYRLIQQ